MHSGADVDAFTAALNRDIEGDGLGDSHSAAAPDSAASGADVDAFTAALNRDIEGDGLGDSHSLPSDSLPR
ncbi:hypothetical protein Drorol1_Dr00002174 [Drosera rotundifolia]